MEQNNSFEYTYSAQQQKEVETIRQKYLPKEENKMEQLRRLDQGVIQKAQAWSIALGVIGALLLGLGMSLCMTELGAGLGQLAMPLGIAVGLAGIGLTVSAYPAHNYVLKKERQKIAPEILRLSDELLK